MPRSLISFAFYASSLAIMLLMATSAVAQELRIETSVYVEDDSEPVSDAQTLFDGEMVYHFVEQPAQVTVYRAPGPNRDGQFIILDLDREQRTDISTKRIGSLMKKLTKWAGEQEDPLLKFSAQPVFEKTFDEDSGVLTLENPAWTYTVATVPAEDTNSMARYREFTDWYSRLNTMLHSSPPPGARLELNKVMSSHKVVPVEIRRTVESQDDSLRATHLFTWRLSREDRQRIDATRGQLASFQKVENAEFIARGKEEAVVRGQSK